MRLMTGAAYSVMKATMASCIVVPAGPTSGYAPILSLRADVPVRQRRANSGSRRTTLAARQLYRAAPEGGKALNEA
jgi:hypothetical protein